MKRCIVCIGAGAALLAGCEFLDDERSVYVQPEEPSSALFTLEDVAQLLSTVPVQTAQVQEVYDAVTSSCGNGYDEEYTLRNLFAAPGTGVGDALSRAADHPYDTPLRDLLSDAIRRSPFTRSGADGGGAEPVDPEAYINALAASDVQIYWPYSAAWDGVQAPVITFDPGDASERNVGYTLDGEVVLVDEDLAARRPVWVVNRNADAAYRTLELLRREDPSWGEGGGDILVRSMAAKAASPTRAPGEERTLVLRSFKANRNYDSWFAGASEFFVKCGAVEDFTASTDAELRLYEPSITDFMIVVRRSQVGEEIPFNAVLVSEWTGQLSNCAFMITEDDGGLRTSWKCSAVVKYNSKSYGFEIEIPLNSRDDVVWRGALSRSYIERYSGTVGHFGDVELVLELVE